jgi:hypothetical protein
VLQETVKYMACIFTESGFIVSFSGYTINARKGSKRDAVWPQNKIKGTIPLHTLLGIF